ncbi:hypothetical protein GCM10028796_01240 [Ramlibacter monticola]|uniref:Uncharacterized protein n=1 Tax=Ramlibacter monticola TaxID=1926872 RepID=A0A936YZU2_9BURK|nr:hypothetical protein [Ramlibacter monticola]MBL0391581.1 hypothetical protein [Ramlibacter monticola]
MTASELSQIIRSYQRNPRIAGVLSTGERILLAIAMCDASLLPPGYEQPQDAWRRLPAHEIAEIQKAVLLSAVAA